MDRRRFLQIIALAPAAALLPSPPPRADVSARYASGGVVTSWPRAVIGESVSETIVLPGVATSADAWRLGRRQLEILRSLDD
jgi:hypothetical protein